MTILCVSSSCRDILCCESLAFIVYVTMPSRLLEAALAWELATRRKANAGDEEAVRDRRRRMDEATTAAKVEK